MKANSFLTLLTPCLLTSDQRLKFNKRLPERITAQAAKLKNRRQAQKAKQSALFADPVPSLS